MSQQAEWSLTRELQQERSPVAWRLWEELCGAAEFHRMSDDERERVGILAAGVSRLIERGQEITEARAQEIRALAGLGGGA